MENLDFTEDEIREQLTVLGYKNIPKQRLLEFKRDLDELIRCGDWRSLTPSRQANAKSQEAPAQPSPPAYTKEKVGSMEGFFLHARQDQQVLISGPNAGDRWEQGARDSYAQHTVAPKLRLPQGEPNRLQVEPGPVEAPNSPLSDSQASSSDAQGRRFIKRKVLRKHKGQQHVCDESVYSEDSAVHGVHSPHGEAAVPNAAMSKMYNSQEADDSSDERSSLYSSFWSDEEKQEEEEEEEVEIERGVDVEPVQDVARSNQETAEVKRPELNERGSVSGEGQPEGSSKSEEEENRDESEEEEGEEDAGEDDEEDEEEDEKELEDADQDEEEPNGPEEEVEGKDEDGLMSKIKDGEEDRNEDKDEEGVEEEFEGADQGEEEPDGPEEEIEGEDEDGLIGKVEDGEEDGNEDENEEDEEEDEEELEGADQVEEEPNGPEEEIEGEDEDGLIGKVEDGEEDRNEDKDEEGVEEELEGADQGEEESDGPEEEIQGEDEDGLIGKVEDGEEDGNEDENEEDEEEDEEELEGADQEEEEPDGPEEEIEGEDEEELMSKVEDGEEDGNEDESEEDEKKCGSSSDSPTPSLMTSGYGTYRPEEQEGGDYRDDHTLTEFDQDSRGDLSEVRDLEDDSRSLRSFSELDAEPTHEPDFSEVSGCAVEDEFPDAAHPGNHDPQEGIHRPASRVEPEEPSCREGSEVPSATAEAVTDTAREEPRPVKAGDRPPLDEGREDTEPELEGERPASTEKVDAVDSEDPDESSSNKDIKFIDSKANLGWLTYDGMCLEWEGNLRQTKDAASCLEGRLADLQISPSAHQDPEKENDGEIDRSDTHSSDTESLSAFESYMRGLTRTQSDSDLRPKPKSFIRPAISQQTIKKTDPVAKYFQYKQLWDMFKCPGEVDRRALRWEIREKLAYQPPPPKPRRVYVPNTYIVPTEKKRSALRWEVRNDMANGLHPYKSSCRF